MLFTHSQMGYQVLAQKWGRRPFSEVLGRFGVPPISHRIMKNVNDPFLGGNDFFIKFL